VYKSQEDFYLLAVSYGRLQKGNDDVTVPLLSASKGRRDEENLTGLPNPCSLSIGGHDPSYAYQILNHFMFFAWIGTQILQRYILLPIPFWLVLYRLTEIELLLIVTLIYNKDMPTGQVMQRETYCTSCKQNVPITDAAYVRLANGRAIIKGKCSRCGLELIKASIMPKSSALTLLRKKRRRRGERSLPTP
jgi:hypothetical protein